MFIFDFVMALLFLALAMHSGYVVYKCRYLANVLGDVLNGKGLTSIDLNKCILNESTVRQYINILDSEGCPTHMSDAMCGLLLHIKSSTHTMWLYTWSALVWVAIMAYKIYW